MLVSHKGLGKFGMFLVLLRYFWTYSCRNVGDLLAGQKMTFPLSVIVVRRNRLR